MEGNKMEILDFNHYVQRVKQANLHPKQVPHLEIYTSCPLKNMNHLIFYGPPGIGKYSQVLNFVSVFSANELKYEKKISIADETNPKVQLFKTKVSDIHYEIDLALLGCLSKSVWHTIYSQFVEIILTKPHKIGIIVCRNFHAIHGELLNVFYSYIQHKCLSKVIIKFIFITESISFIPDSILNCCDIISFSKPLKSAYARILQNNMFQGSDEPTSLRGFQHSQLENITNIRLSELECEMMKNAKIKLKQDKKEDKKDAENVENENENENCNALQSPHTIICQPLCDFLSKPETVNIILVRNILYDILIYNINLNDCVWLLLMQAESIITEKNKTQPDMINSKITQLLVKSTQFFQLYNNNYRPIYHMELFFFNLLNIVEND